MVLLRAVGASLVTSIVPALLLLVIQRSWVKPYVLRVMLAFAAGGLLGDVFLHQLPSIVGGGGHDHDHEHGDRDNGDHHHHHDNTQMLILLGGIVFFFALEGVMKHLTGGGGHDHSHGGGRGGGGSKTTPAKKTTKKDTVSLVKSSGRASSKRRSTSKKAASQSQQKDSDVDEDGTPNGSSLSSIAAGGSGSNPTKAWLNLIADTAHNFTDGFVIGVSYLSSPLTAHRTTLLILIHEVPHELGDFAVLASCGWTRRDIFWFQLVTGLGNLMGTVLVVLVGTAVEGASYYIGPFAAGTFIYMGLVTILSELNSAAEADDGDKGDNKKETKSSELMKERLVHCLALALGISSMLGVTYLEEMMGVHCH